MSSRRSRWTRSNERRATTNQKQDLAIIETIEAASKGASPRIVLAEGEDLRVVKAAIQAAHDGVAKVSVVADRYHRCAGNGPEGN